MTKSESQVVNESMVDSIRAISKIKQMDRSSPSMSDEALAALQEIEDSVRRVARMAEAELKSTDKS